MFIQQCEWSALEPIYAVTCFVLSSHFWLCWTWPGKLVCYLCHFCLESFDTIIKIVCYRKQYTIAIIYSFPSDFFSLIILLSNSFT